jgi:hypothetical protein
MHAATVEKLTAVLLREIGRACATAGIVEHSAGAHDGGCLEV